MIKLSRLQLIKWHALLACFFLPVATLFFISGALYTLDIKGKSHKQTFTIALDEPFVPNLDTLTQIASDILFDRNIPLPNGEPHLSKKKNRYVFSWRDIEHTIQLVPNKNKSAVKVTLHNRNWLAQIMYFHTANAGEFFKAISVAMVTVLFIILSTGVLMAQSMPALRKPSWIALALGSGTIILLMALN